MAILRWLQTQSPLQLFSQILFWVFPIVGYLLSLPIWQIVAIWLLIPPFFYWLNRQLTRTTMKVFTVKLGRTATIVEQLLTDNKLSFERQKGKGSVKFEIPDEGFTVELESHPLNPRDKNSKHGTKFEIKGKSRQNSTTIKKLSDHIDQTAELIQK